MMDLVFQLVTLLEGFGKHVKSGTFGVNVELRIFAAPRLISERV
jgi:hypothetical protein